MEPREGIRNLLITCALLVLVTILALILRSTRSVPVAVRVNEARLVAEPTAATAPQQKLSERFQTAHNAKLVEAASNEADTLRLKAFGGEFTFVHYFIDALETTNTHPTRVSDQARYFGKAAPGDVVLVGKEALDYVRSLLSSRPFFVLTRWERVPNTERYYALIMVEYEKDKRAYLSDLLMRQGFARVDGVTTALPDDPRDDSAYLLELKQHGRYAQQKRVGIWAKVKG